MAIDTTPKTRGEPSIQSLASGLGTLGRYGDNYMVHAAEGETFVPKEILDANPNLKSALFQQMKMMGIEDPNRYVVGDALNSINPITGQPEFFFKKIWSKIKKVVKSIAPVVAPIIGNMILPGIGGLLASGLASKISGGSWGDALKAMATSYAVQGVASGFSGKGGFSMDKLQKGFTTPFKALGDLPGSFDQGIFGSAGYTKMLPQYDPEYDPAAAEAAAAEAAEVKLLEQSPNDGIQYGPKGDPTGFDSDGYFSNNPLGDEGSPETFNRNLSISRATGLPPNQYLNPQNPGFDSDGYFSTNPLGDEATALGNRRPTGIERLKINQGIPLNAELNSLGINPKDTMAGRADLVSEYFAEKDMLANPKDYYQTALDGDGNILPEPAEKGFLQDYILDPVAGFTEPVLGKKLAEQTALPITLASAAALYTLTAAEEEKIPGPSASSRKQKAYEAWRNIADKDSQEAINFYRTWYGQPQFTRADYEKRAGKNHGRPDWWFKDYGMSVAGGGEVMGPGTGTSDSIPARLSDGEFVMTARAVENAGGGNRSLGAARMYDMMNRFERGAA